MFEELTNEEMEKIDGDGLFKFLLGEIGTVACLIGGGVCGATAGVFGAVAGSCDVEKPLLLCDECTNACYEWAYSEGWCYIW